VIDRDGNKAARQLVAEVKVSVARMAQDVVDKAIQIHGGAGVSGDLPLAYMVCPSCLAGVCVLPSG
jgi:alkylation response protein AidB-like acyl-CoA dehydrogenase